MRPRSLLAPVVLACALLSACAAPPSREMDQAQAAIEAARAAGAEQYALEEYHAAVTALKQAQDAAGQRDYRRALDQALDSRERAQNAVRQTADEKAALRSETERALSEVRALLDQANGRLAAAAAARIPRRTLMGLHAAIADVNAGVQEAGAAVAEGNHRAAGQQLSDAGTRLRAAMAELDATMNGRGGRLRR